ncbi:MAG: hypothetical protein ACO1N7_12170 [Sphingobacteriaceae bacterium]
MVLKFSSILLVVSIILSGCGKSANQKNIEKREKEIQQKEQQLKAFEQQLKLKEQNLLSREKQLDSLKTKADTIGVYNPKLVGNWRVNMQCIETTCEGSAIGDTKTEQWNISYNNNKVVANALSNKKIIRVYTGLFKENTLELKAQPTDLETEMNVVLTPHSSTENLMEGRRIINHSGKCKIVYALKAEKI